MWRTCKIVAQVHMWQCDLLPSSPSPISISGISPHAVSSQLPTPHCPSLFPPSRCQCVVLPSLCPCALIVHHPPMSGTCGVWFSVLVSVAENDGFQLHSCLCKELRQIIRKKKTSNPIKKWVKDMNKHPSKGGIYEAKKDVKKSSSSLVIKEMQIKTTLRYHLMPVRMAIIKKWRDNRC